MNTELKIILLFGLIIILQGVFIMFPTDLNIEVKPSIVSYNDCDNLKDNYAKSLMIINATCQTSTIDHLKDMAVGGLYLPYKDIACMRTDTYYNDTKYHEVCHGLLESNYQHFCVDYKN